MIWNNLLAFVLAKMQIAGIKVKKKPCLRCRLEMNPVIESPLQEIYELAGEEPPSILTLSSWACFLKSSASSRIHQEKPRQVTLTAVDVLGASGPIAPIVKKILDYRQMLKFNRLTWLACRIGLDDGKIHMRYVQDLTWQIVRQFQWIQTCKIFCSFGNSAASFVRLLCARVR